MGGITHHTKTALPALIPPESYDEEHDIDDASIPVAKLSDHTKATHDALGIDADTVDGSHAAAFEASGASAAHSALTTGVHGAGASTLATTANITTHAALDTGVHGAGGDTLATDADITTHAALDTGVHGAGASTVATAADITTHNAAANAHGCDGNNTHFWRGDNAWAAPAGAAGSYGSYTYLILKNGVDWEAYNNAGVLVYGGAADVGGVDGLDVAAVIEACWVSGAKIFLSGRNETWTLLGEINSQAAGVIVEGGGFNNPEIYLGNGLDVDVFDITHEDCKIVNVHIDGNWLNQTIDNGASTNAVSRGIRVSGDNVTIQGCYIEKIAQDGITYAACEGGLCTGNTLLDIGWNGISTFRLPTPGYGVDICNNSVRQCGDIGITCYGSRTNVHHNFVYDINGSHGSLNTRWGIGIEGGDWNVVSDNIIDDFLCGVCTGSVGGEDPQFWTIKNNTFTGMTAASAGGHCIHIKARHGQVVDNVMDEIVNWGAPWVVGLFIGAGSNNIKLSGNQYNGAGTYLGIQIQSENDIKISNEHFWGAGWGAIMVDGACHRLVVDGCTIEDGARFIVTQNTAQSDDVRIANNFIYSMSTVAIDMQDNDDMCIFGNTIRDCALGLDISNANVVRCLVANNDFYGCTTDVSAAGAGSVNYGYNKDSAGNWDEGVEP